MISPQFLNNQSDRRSIVKQDGQKSIAILPAGYNWLRSIFQMVGVEINDFKVNISTNIQHI